MEKQDKILEIYEAALKVFAEYGFKKATVEDIASHLGLTKGALYIYIRDKKELYEKAVGYAMLKWQNRVKDAVSKEDDVEKQFYIMCYKAYEYLAEDAILRKILVKDPSIFPIFPLQDPYGEINNSSIDLLRGILKKGVEEKRFRNVDIDVVTKLIFTLYKMMILETYVINDEAPKLVFSELVNLITKGLFIDK
ncbi:MAG: TetR/AcrR family transcriptional regulator [Bacillota bacterium]